MANNIKEKLFADYEAKIADINAICTKGTNAEIEGKLAQLKEIEADYRNVLEREVFGSLMDVHEALEKHHFMTISHKVVREEGVMTGVEKTDRMVQVDLKKFCEAKGFELDWYYELQSLNKRLTLRVMEALGCSEKERRAIDDSYNMEKLAKEIDLGKTPTSDTQCVKHMQKVLDLLSEGEGRVTNHDLKYIMLLYAKKDNKTALKVVCSKHSFLQSLLTDVFHRVVVNGSYTVDYKRIQSKIEVSNPASEGSEVKTETKVSKPKKVSDAKPKTSKPKKATEPAAKVSKPISEVSEPETVVVKKTA